MTYGDPNWQPWIMDEAASLPLIKHAFDRGINTWDVADTYSNGRSEEILGTAIKKYSLPREKLVIMSKCFHEVDESRGPIDVAGFGVNDGERVNRVGLSRKHIFDVVDRSVERLGTYIDVLQIHRLDRETPMEEIMKALNDVVESGKVRYIGASSVRLPSSARIVTLLTFYPDGGMGVPDAPEYRGEAWLAQVHFDAGILQPCVPRGRARVDSLL
jgi:aryl-alcohol dehydrogenase-like predicted oxidoreductase